MSVLGYGLEPYGYGPYGGLGGVTLPATTPPLGGYGGYSYGTSSYGSLGSFGDAEIAVTGGYGGCAYGTSPYGCIAGTLNPPEVIAAISITGYIIEVFFSNEMSPDADLFNPASYILTDLVGAAPSTVLSVEEGVPGVWGPTSVLLHHTGTTLGGLYRVTVSGPRDIGGTEIAAYAPLNQAELLTKGEPPPFTITPISGDELLYEFEYHMLTEVEFSPGIEQLDAYGFETTYPQNILPQLITFPYLADLKQMKMDVLGMTSAQYSGIVSPATAISYDGTYLPTSPEADFAAQELGTGSTTQGVDEVLLSTPAGFAYGWRFVDTSGRALPDSSYRVDITFDASRTTVINPPLFDETFILIIVSDSDIEVNLTFTRVAGVDTLEVNSGIFSTSTSIAWSTAETTVSVVRNQRADTYTIVVNDEPIVSGLTASFTAPAGTPSGVQFLLDPNGSYEIEDFPLMDILYTATQTVFSAAWNFLHNQQAPFQGNNALAKDFLLTQKGPLVKGWGDATPATKQNVVVYVNGVPVGIASVNPYYGKIFLEIPIPLMPPGFMEVTVDYIWFPTPVMEMAGLNTLGLVLNKIACRPLCPSSINNWSEGVGLPGGGTNGIEFSRFPMGVVLGPRSLRQPLLRSPRFIAFQKAYTAALNSPTTLLLNRNPHQVALDGESRMTQGTTTFYEGNVDPVDADPTWEIVGFNDIALSDEIDVTTGDLFSTNGLIDQPTANIFNSTEVGIWQIYDVTAGSFGEGETAFYTQTFDVSFPSTLTMVVRLQIRTDGLDPEGDPLPQPDGVFTGVGFGCHDDNHLYLVGFLLINDVQHIGMLIEPAFPELQESWQVAYETPIAVQNDVTFTMDSDEVPQRVRERLISDDIVRFQILEGNQAGVYQVLQIVDQSDGSSTVTISSDNPFPANPQVWPNRDVTAFFESRWDGDGIVETLTTYRLVVQHDVKNLPKGRAELFVGGDLAGQALELDGAPPFAVPPDGVLLYPTGNAGEVFWGSVDRRAKNLSDWTFVRYGLEPGVTTQNFRGIVVAAEMNDLPEDDPNNVWFLTQNFGYDEIDSTGDNLLLKSTSSITGLLVEQETGTFTQNGQVFVQDTEIVTPNLDLTFGYARIEPFLTRKLAIDLDTTLQIDTGVLGAGDLIYSIKDGLREVRLANILYEESLVDRQLLFLPNVSLSGLYLPETQINWTKTGDLTSIRVQGARLQFEQSVGESVLYTVDLIQPGEPPAPSGGRVLEARLQIEAASTTEVNGNTGIFIGTDAGSGGAERGVGLSLRAAVGGDPNRLVLFSTETGADVTFFDFDWNDGNLHDYRVLIDTDVDTVSLVVDDTVLGTADYTLFAFSSTDTQLSFGFVGTETVTQAQLFDLSVASLAPSTAFRTLGVWLGGDVDDIDNWELPRTDTLKVPNSDLSAVIEQMDWRQRLKVRIHRDPGWGVTILRPDIPPPPYFDGDFATQFTEPSAGWINVEYRYLPRVSSSDLFGYISFGALDNRSITQMRIDEVRYRIYRYASENMIMPPHMVLNQFNVITSDEWCKDVTVETDTVLSTDSITIHLSILHVTVDRVFNFSFVNPQGETVVYNPGSFIFDKETQTITITSDITLAYFPSLDVLDEEDPFVINPSLNVDVEPDGPFPLPAGFSRQDLFDKNYDPKDQGGYPLDTQVEVTVNYAISRPLSLTYLCKQPLLQGSTLLYEGTPPFETSQVGKDMGALAWGSRINDPNDTLNDDPDFILNDPFRFIEFTKNKGIVYEDIEFCEVSEGEACRLSPFCDDNVPGASQAGHAGNEPGDIGNGLINMGFEGLAFTESDPITFHDGPTGPFGELLSSVFLKASGGDAPPGGNLQEAILFTPLGPSTPSFQSPDGSVGWSVFGQLYDTLTDTTTLIYFGTESLGP